MMKKYLHTVLAAGCVSLLMLASCKKDETKVVADPANAKGGTLSASASTLVLTKATETNTAVTFTVTQPNFGYAAAPTNTLQLDVSGDNFASPKEVVLAAKAGSVAYTGLDFNALALSLNMKTGVAAPMQIRVKSQISTGIAPVYSNVVTVTVTPYPLISYVYVPGAYQGWTPATADSLKSATGNGVYTGIINFTGSSDLTFKVTSDKKGTTWYGTLNGAVSSDGSASNFSFVTATTVDPAVNITSDQVTIDLNKNTIALVPTLWSIVGDASPGGWPDGSGHQSDTDMKFNNGTQTWSATVALKAGGAIKFRKNHDWGTNYGSVTTAGVLDQANNNNISITTSGTYLVTADFVNLTYTLTKQ